MPTTTPPSPRVRPSRRPSAARFRHLAGVLLALSTGACADRALPLEPTADPSLSAAAAGTQRTPRGDLITAEAEIFAQTLREIGRGGEVLIWLKETGTPRLSAEFFLNLPTGGAEAVALPADDPGVRRRGGFGAPRVSRGARTAVAQVLTRAGVGEVEVMQSLPVISVRLPENARIDALRGLLRHPNVDYVSAVRARPVELRSAPVGSNAIDLKHTVHNVPQAWALTRGSGARIGVLDTGFARSSATGQYHDDGLWHGTHGIIPKGFIDDTCSKAQANAGNCVAFDDGWRAGSGSYPHGTGAVGLVAQNDNNHGHVGIAPFSTTYSMKIFWNTYIQGHCGFWPGNNNSLCMEDDDFVRAVDWAASQRLHVLSMSFGGSFGSDVYRALASAYNYYGVFLVAGVSNTPGGASGEPASYDVVVGVGGVDQWGNTPHGTHNRLVSGLAGGASMGATCYQYSYCDAGYPGIMGGIGGTSAGTANVAGIVGLIRAYHPHESVTQVRTRLLATAQGPNAVVDAYAALTYVMPLAVNIHGPTSVRSWEYHTWTAAATGGTQPYSYVWRKDGQVVGTGAWYSDGGLWGGMQLQVTVTGANGATASHTIWVTVDDCPQEPGMPPMVCNVN